MSVVFVVLHPSPPVTEEFFFFTPLVIISCIPRRMPSHSTLCANILSKLVRETCSQRELCLNAVLHSRVSKNGKRNAGVKKVVVDEDQDQTSRLSQEALCIEMFQKSKQTHLVCVLLVASTPADACGQLSECVSLRFSFLHHPASVCLAGSLISCPAQTGPDGILHSSY